MSGIEFGMLMVAWVLAGASPGPATLAISGTAMQYGRRAGLALAFGVVCGSAFWALAAALGLGALMLTHGWVIEALRYSAAAYLMFLAIKALKSALAAKPIERIDLGAQSVKGFYFKGLLIHLTNPKAVLSWGAVFSVAIAPNAPLSELIRVGGSLMVLSILLFPGYALIFSSRPAIAVYAWIGRWIEGAFGLLFGLASLRILTARLT